MWYGLTGKDILNSQNRLESGDGRTPEKIAADVDENVV
jgi:hypothetical protein